MKMSRTFNEIPIHGLFWDPFVKRIFVKQDKDRASCLDPEWGSFLSDFDRDEEVFISSTNNNKHSSRVKELIKQFELSRI